MAPKKHTQREMKWKVIANCQYHKDREQRLALAFEQIWPEKTLLLTPSKKELENEEKENSALCSGLKRKTGTR
jgi:hypothetical protein